MGRIETTCLVVAGLAAATPAVAKDNGPYMWGVGGHVSTMIIPGRYPITFPTKIENYNFIDDDTDPLSGDPNSDEPKRDLNPNTDEPIYSTLERVRNDISVGGDFVYYLDNTHRIGALAELATGKRYFDVEFLGRYDNVVVRQDQFQVLVGGGIGFGSMRYSGASSPEKLQVSYFPVRLNVGALVRLDTAAVALSLYAKSAIPSNQQYTKLDGDVVDSVGSPFALASYLSSGLELTVMFGDFKPPKKPSGKGGKGGNGGKGGKGGKGKQA